MRPRFSASLSPVSVSVSRCGSLETTRRVKREDCGAGILYRKTSFLRKCVEGSASCHVFFPKRRSRVKRRSITCEIYLRRLAQRDACARVPGWARARQKREPITQRARGFCMRAASRVVCCRASGRVNLEFTYLCESRSRIGSELGGEDMLHSP